MDHMLAELVAVCRAADTEKVTERKKQIEKLGRLLKKGSIVKALDRNSEAKQGFGWDKLFKVARNLVWTECASLQKAKDATSVTSQKKKQDVISLLKEVVRQGNKRGHYLKGVDVVRHVVNIMEDDFARAAFGGDHTSILLKDILSVRKYWCELTQKSWHELLYLYLQQQKENHEGFDRVLLARLIHVVVVGSSRQCDIKGRKILPLLQEYFAGIKKERSMSVIEHMVSALNVLCQSMAMDSRVQICRLGENIFVSLLYIWNNQKPSEGLKDEIVMFMQLQMSAHHPMGAKTEADGAFAVNWDLWKSNLRRLYEVLYKVLQETGGRSKYSTGSREFTQSQLKPEFVCLAADVCHQLFEESSSVVEVTQASFLDSTMAETSQPGGATKKRRLESGWEVIRDVIQSQGHSFTAIPWLQVLTTLLQKYPSWLPEAELAPLLGALQQVYVESKKHDVTKWLQRCLCALACGHSKMAAKVTEFTLETCRGHWQKVWTGTLRLISLHHTKEEGFQLLTTLLIEDLIKPDKDVWTLFLPHLCQCSTAAVNFLCKILQNHDLPEKFRPNMLVSMETLADVPYPLRHQLLDWLLPHDEWGDSGRKTQKERIHAPLLAATLVSLTMRDPRTVRAPINYLAVTQQEGFEHLEQTYLRTSFDLDLELPSDVKETGSGQEVGQVSTLQVLEKRLSSLLVRDSRLLLDATEIDIRLAEDLASQCSLLAKVLHSQLSHGLLTSSNMTSSQLYDLLKALMKKLTSTLAEVTSRDGSSSLGAVMSSLTSMYQWDGTVSSHQMAQACRDLTPRELVDKLLSIVFDQGKRHKVVPLRRSSSKRQPVLDDFDEMDLEFGDTARNESDDDDDMGFEGISDDQSESQDSDAFGAQAVGGCRSLLSPSLLSEKESLRLQVVTLLCHYCAFDTEDNNGVRGSGVNTEVVRGKLMELLDQDKHSFDFDKAFDLQLLRCLVENLSSCDHSLTDANLGDLVQSTRLVCQNQRRDQELCGVMLGLLARLVPHLSGSEDMVSSSRLNTRNLALFLTGVFRKLVNEYGSQIRMALAECMQTFIQNDPDGEWTCWSSKPRGDDSDDDTSEQLSDVFPGLLKDRHHGIRLMAATSIRSLFAKKTGDGTQPYSRDKQDLVFDNVYAALQESINIEGRFSPDEQKDEVYNRTSSLLHTLATVACCSAACEKKALFGISQMMKMNNFEIPLVKKVLEFVASKLGYQSLRSFMDSHLPYLVDQWLDSGYSITEFPYQLVGHSDRKDFYRSRHQTFIPFLVMCKDLDSVKMVASQLDTDMADILKPAIPGILTHVLPYFATSTGAAGEGQAMKNSKRANACYDMLIEAVGQESIEQFIVGRLDVVVVNILMTLHDSTDHKPPAQFIRDCDPEPNPPHWTTRSITSTLAYLTKSHGDKIKTLVGLLSKSQDGIQKILLSLRQLLTREHRAHEKCRILQMYRLFVQLLLQEFRLELGGSWAFVLRDVIFTLLHLIQEVQETGVQNGGYVEDLALMCCDLLKSLCMEAAEVCPEELGRFLSSVVSILVPSAQKDDKFGQECLSLVKFLIVENETGLGQAVGLLDPLPDSPAFTRARRAQAKLKYAAKEFSLEEELEHFLKAGSHCHCGAESHGAGRLEGLKFLREQLNTRKQELAQLVQDCRVAESQSDNPLLKVIYRLIQLSRSANESTAQEAGRCLGELGPADLSIIALKGDAHSPSLAAALGGYSNSNKMRQYCEIFHLLDGYLVDARIDTVTAASEVLKKLLCTRTGQGFYTSYKTKVQDHFFQYLHPFKPSRKKIVAVDDQDSSEEAFRTQVDDSALWYPEHGDHQHWVRRLTCRLIDSGGVQDEILRLLAPVCKVKTEFCEVILPFLIHNILANSPGDAHKRLLSHHIQTFFQMHCGVVEEAASRSTTPLLHDKTSDVTVVSLKESVQTLLNVVQYLRLQDRPTTGRSQLTAWDNNFWIDVDYLLVAQAAQNCSAYFTTLLFSEIWCSLQSSKLGQQSSGPQSNGSSQSQGSQSSSQHSQLDRLSSLPHGSGVNVQQLMLKAYRCIGDPDGVYGCGAGTSPSTAARIKTYEHENNWSKALGSYDLEMDLSDSVSSATQTGLLQALQNFGSSHVLDMYLQGLAQQSVGQSADILQFQYEAALRNCNWEMETPNRVDQDTSLSQALYTGVCALKDRDLSLTTTALDVARLAALQRLKDASLESARSLYPILSQLHCISEVNDLANNVLSGGRIDTVLEAWQSQDLVVTNDFEFLEPALTQRCVLLQLLLERHHGNAGIRQGLTRQLTKLTKMAREAGRHMIAERAICKLQHIQGMTSSQDMRQSWRVEEACMFWARGESDTAKHLMKVLIERLDLVQEEDAEAALLYPQCLGIYGNWLAETRSESPHVVMEEYLKKAVDLLGSLGVEDETALDAFLSLARYADTQYQNIVDHQKSSAYEDKQALINKAREDAQKLKQIGEHGRYLRTLEKQLTIDEDEIDEMEHGKKTYLQHAVKNYLKCLQCGDAHNLRVFRLTSLWFDNSAKDDANNVNKLIQRGLPRIPSFKFLPLMYQLAARMSMEGQQGTSQFAAILDQLIERTIVDHPHHTLFIVLALAHANKEKEMIQGKKASGRLSRGASMSTQDSAQEEGRVQAAKAMVERLRATERAQIIADMEKLCIAYIQLANWSVEKYKSETKAINFPGGLLLLQLQKLKNVVLPTMEIRVDPTCQYKDIVHIVGFEPTFKLAGGINLPKIISCRGSDGVSRRQLVKGKDDMRQDAVMQQVFEMVNNLLVKNTETRKRRLKVRTYKVIPLSQRSGLLEWCEGTMPMGEYLIATPNGAHTRYRPHDWAALKCRKTMDGKGKLVTQGDKLDAYMEACRHFQPVFRHFFMERFPDPTDWYEKRLAYTRSVATNSIVGYILGLGDRHVQNILIDCQSAELVQIDLGVAFEQGRILPTPETVPFRLTRDIVDGMGVAGVEGIFRRCCEKTMEVMHQSQEALITILQVLLYDPLYAWTISPEKAHKLQEARDMDASELNATTGDILDVEEQRHSETQENVNKVAERVLLRLRQKLQGVEDGVQLSVSGQVNHLIQEARDPQNLCRLFSGWQPYI